MNIIAIFQAGGSVLAAIAQLQFSNNPVSFRIGAEYFTITRDLTKAVRPQI